jgi:Tfp pilus assembly protein PilX
LSANIRLIPAAQFGPNRERGIALPVALILVTIVLIAAVALMRNVGQDSLVSGNEADRTFATEATDAALRATIAELQALPSIPELIDVNDLSLKWWKSTKTPITAAFWQNCAAGSAGDKCVSESKTVGGTGTQLARTYTVLRVVQPTGVPENIGATSGSYTFFYKVSVLISLDNGTRSEVEAYVRRPQLIRG